MRIARMAAVALLGIGMSAGVLAAASPATAASRTSVNNCGTLEVKPTDLVLACADANSRLTDLKWSGWSNGRAKGVGTYEVNDCQPTCVAGKTRSYPVRVKLDQPKVQEGKRVFTRELIEAAVEEFAKRGLLGTARVEWKNHRDLTIALVERWAAIQSTAK